MPAKAKRTSTPPRRPPRPVRLAPRCDAWIQLATDASDSLRVRCARSSHPDPHHSVMLIAAAGPPWRVSW